MFAKTIVDSDAFVEMPTSARLLYYDLGMRADDDGFVNSPKKIMRMTGAQEDDIKILIAKKFIIPFENGIVVIKHWKIHNYIRKDTYRETPYLEEKSMLELDENNAYRVKVVDDASTQYRLDKIRLDKIRLDKIYDRNFETFYKSYPKKVQKSLVEKWFIKNKPTEEIFDIMITALEKQKQSKQWLKDNGQYIPNPTTWLNQKRWEDETQENMSALKQMYKELGEE